MIDAKPLENKLSHLYSIAEDTLKCSGIILASIDGDPDFYTFLETHDNLKEFLKNISKQVLNALGLSEDIDKRILKSSSGAHFEPENQNPNLYQNYKTAIKALNQGNPDLIVSLWRRQIKLANHYNMQCLLHHIDEHTQNNISTIFKLNDVLTSIARQFNCMKDYEEATNKIANGEDDSDFSNLFKNCLKMANRYNMPLDFSDFPKVKDHNTIIYLVYIFQLYNPYLLDVQKSYDTYKFLKTQKEKNSQLIKIHKSSKAQPNHVHLKTELYPQVPNLKHSIIFDQLGHAFEMLNKIGSGAYGQIKYASHLMKKKLPIVVKIEKVNDGIQYTKKLIEAGLKSQGYQNESLEKKLEGLKQKIEAYVQSQLDIEESVTQALGRYYGSTYRINHQGITKKYLFMEFIEGKNLKDALPDLKNNSERLDIFSNLLASLKEIHDLGFFHLDLNLWNILNGTSLKIIDFGCAMPYLNNLPPKGPIKGTHLPPEVIETLKTNLMITWSAKTDIFAAGMIGYELFTGNVFDAYMDKPFDEYLIQYKAFYKTALSACQTNPTEHPWKILISKMIHPDPEIRLSLKESIRELENHIYDLNIFSKHHEPTRFGRLK